MKAESGIWTSDRGTRLTVERAVGLRRLGGLIGRPAPAPAKALLFNRCRSLHGFWMKRELDAVFLDRRLRVVGVRRLRPWRGIACAAAAHALEMRSGECARMSIAVGDRFEVQPRDDGGPGDPWRGSDRQ